jgi:hypothetical protein
LQNRNRNSLSWDGREKSFSCAWIVKIMNDL